MTPRLIHNADYRLAAAGYSPRHSPAGLLTDGTEEQGWRDGASNERGGI